MKRICTISVAVTASFTLLQSAEAGSRGGSRSFSSGPHFSGPSFSSAHHSVGPSRSFSSAPRFNNSARFSSAPRFHNRSYAASGPRYSTSAALRNPSYLSNRARFSGDRTTAFNTQTSSRTTAGLGAGRTPGTRAQGFNNNRERVVARHNANWRRNWDRGRDHWWRGRRCHFHNNVWVIYEPFFGYPFGYGYYPYGGYYDNGYYDNGYYDNGYYDNGYYDDSYTSNQYSPAPYANQPESDPGSRVSDVQSALAREGYYDGPIDGKLGDATRRALRKYQRDHNLDVTGAINRPLIEALRLR
jgi:hypothetical protein